MKLLDSLLDAIVRLEGDALVMHVGEKPYVVTASSSMNAYRGPLAWGQVELSSRVLTFDAVSSMLGQILPADQQQALTEFGAIEHEIPSPAGVADRFTVVAARGGEDVWVELRRRPIELQQAAAPTAATSDAAVASGAVDQQAAAAPQHETAAAVAEPPATPQAVHAAPVGPTVIEPAVVEPAAEDVSVAATPAHAGAAPSLEATAPQEQEIEPAGSQSIEPAGSIEIQDIEVVADAGEEPAAQVEFDNDSSIVVAMPGDDAQEIALNAVPDNAIQLVEDEAQGVPTEEEVDAMLAATAGAILTSGMAEVVDDGASAGDEMGQVESIGEDEEDDENEIVLDVEVAAAAHSIGLTEVAAEQPARLTEVAAEQPAGLTEVAAEQPAPEASSGTDVAFELSPPPQETAPLEPESIEQETPAEVPAGTPLFSEEAMLAAAAPVDVTPSTEAAVAEPVAEPASQALEPESGIQPVEAAPAIEPVASEQPVTTEQVEYPLSSEQPQSPWAQAPWPQATDSPVAGDVLASEVEPQPIAEVTQPEPEPEPPVWTPAAPITWTPPQDLQSAPQDGLASPEFTWRPELPAHFEPAAFEPTAANESAAKAELPPQIETGAVAHAELPTQVEAMPVAHAELPTQIEAGAVAHDVPAPAQPDFAAMVPTFESVAAHDSVVENAAVGYAAADSAAAGDAVPDHAVVDDAVAVDAAAGTGAPHEESSDIAGSVAPPQIEESPAVSAAAPIEPAHAGYDPGDSSPEPRAPSPEFVPPVPEVSAYTSQSAEFATSEPAPHIEAPSVSEMTMEVTPELRRQESPVHMAGEAAASIGASVPSAHEPVNGEASTHAEDDSRHGVVVPLGRAASKPEAAAPYTPSEDAALMHTLRAAAARGASTVYVVAQSKPMIRIDGEIGPLESEPMLTASDVERLVLELAPPRRRDALQNGPVEWLCDVPEIGRVRCLTFRDHRGPGVLFRMIPPRAISADQLGLTPEVQALCQQSDGLVIVTGARASGKSTLLNSFVDLINRTRSDHVITIESQIGFVHESRKSFISQRETRGDADLAATYARAALREDPDVMMIEDLKSADVVAAALEAAESGRLVLASVPAASTIAALERLIEVFPADRRTKARTMLAGALRGVIAQVLLRRVTGGRVPAREILLNTPAVAQIVLEGKMFQLPVALDSGRRHGMVPLTDSLAVHVRDGSVSVAEAYRKALDRAALVALLKREGFDTSFAERLA